MTALVALPWFDRVERRWSFWLPFGAAVGGLLTRFDVVSFLPGDEIHRAHVVFWLFALGWATVKATRPLHRVLVSVLVVTTVPGFFEEPGRDALVVAGMLMLVWVGSVRVPSWFARVAGVLASASLYIYLAHWQVYPYLEDRFTSPPRCSRSRPACCCGRSCPRRCRSWSAGSVRRWHQGRRTTRRLDRSARPVPEPDAWIGRDAPTLPSGVAGRDDAGFVGEHHRLHAVAEAELVQHGPDVRLDRALAQVQPGAISPFEPRASSGRTSRSRAVSRSSSADA